MHETHVSVFLACVYIWHQVRVFLACVYISHVRVFLACVYIWHQVLFSVWVCQFQQAGMLDLRCHRKKMTMHAQLEVWQVPARLFCQLCCVADFRLSLWLWM
jgi:hypothetical protein